MSKRITAAEQFTALGITDPADYTPAMQVAVKQRWSLLPVTETADSLRSQIAAVKPEATPSAEDILGDGAVDSPLEAEKEAARLKRNAGVNAWRTRTQLQAALDARSIKFARMRAGKKGLASQADQVAPATDSATEVPA